MVERPAPRPAGDLFTVVVHWLLVATLLVSLGTGLRIAADDLGSLVGAIGRRLDGLLPQGAVIGWHVLASWLLLTVGIAYAAFVWRTGQGARIVPSRGGLRQLGGALLRPLRRADRQVWFAFNALLFQVAFLLLVLMAATGWMIYRDIHLGLPARLLTNLHGAGATLLIAYVGLHVLAQFRLDQILKLLRPRPGYAGPAWVAAGVAVAAIALAAVLDRSAFSDLRVPQIATPPTLDGDGGDPAWQAAVPVTIATLRGANLPDGAVDVEVAAVHDAEHVYLRFRWPDEEASLLHMPLVKRTDGWELMQTGYENDDENVWYEDKLAVALARSPRLGSGTTHLGRGLSEGAHKPLNRGLHYSEDGAIVDLWHWKAVRTGTMRPGFVDDDHFGPPLPEGKPGARYTGGYTQDPVESGGYVLNFTKLEPDQPLGVSPVVPSFLPADPRVLAATSLASREGAVAPLEPVSLAADQVVPYAPELDTYPVGTVMPGVVIKGPFTGDRGDVLGEATWQDGVWTLEVARRLETGSPYDVPLRRGEAVYLWVSVFNHTQTRHSQHLRSIRVVLD
jgi:cytochrome b subunit of formate dehydrogenase